MEKFLHTLLDEAESEIVDHHIKPDRFFYLRPSGFPYCGLRKLLTGPTLLEEGQTGDLAGAYFTSVGTAAHLTFQEFVGRSKRVVGDWKCRECKREWKFSTYRKCECGANPLYEELEIRYRKTVVGHLDGLVEVKPGGPYIVIDYKTATTSKIVKGRTDPNVFPYAYNVQQIKRYVILMELCFNIRVVGWGLIYLNRDVPLGQNNRKVVYVEVPDEEKKALRKEMRRWIEVHRKVLVARTRAEFDEIKDQKLCASDKDYMTNWHNEYSTCPLRPVCFNSKRLERKIDTMLKSDYYPLINHASKQLRKDMGIKKIKME